MVIPSWWVWVLLLTVFALPFLVACTGGGRSPGVGSLAATVEVVETSTATGVQIEVGDLEPLPTETVSRTRDIQPSPTMEQVRQPEPASVEICSPLAVHPIAELPEIVSGDYDPPPPGKEERHQGVDFSYYRRGERSSIQGVQVTSVFPGQVACSVEGSFPYGNMVIIETPQDQLPQELIKQLGLGEGESLYLLYAHMEAEPEVALGDTVAACQPLGAVGVSGNAGVPHLHLEARVGPAGVGFEGMAYYSTQTTVEERSNYETWRTSGVFRHLDPMEVFGY